MRGLLGLAALLAIAWALSEDRRRIPWRTVIAGVALQWALALLLLFFPPANALIFLLNDGATALQNATQAGTSFVFGYLGGPPLPFAETHPGASFILAFQALPLVLTISALASLLFHWGVLQRITAAFAWLLRRAMGIGGALALGAAVHVFVGMIEAPLLVRPYLARMQRGELFALMTCGMAGVAGTVMVIYASFLAPLVPNALGNILIASVISTPAGLAVAALMVPFGPAEAAEERLVIEDPPLSALDALVKGTIDGVPVLVGIVATLLVAVAFVALINAALGVLPHWGDAADHAAAHLRLAVPPGDVADRRAVGRSRHRGDADGHQDGAERVRRLSELFRTAAGRVRAALAADPDLCIVRLREFRQPGHRDRRTRRDGPGAAA